MTRTLIDTAIRLRGVTCRRGAVEVLRDIDLDVSRGRLLAVVGPNGSGKSTLLDVLAGDLTPTSGTVSYDDRPVESIPPRDLARLRALLPQHNGVSFAFSVLEVVQMGRYPWPSDAQRDTVAVQASLATADVELLTSRAFNQLSGGERARVSLARVLAQDTPLVLLDEPTAALDLRHQESVLGAARELAVGGRAVVVVMHDLSLAAAYADELVVVDGGRIVAHGDVDTVLTPAAVEQTWKHPVELLEDANGYRVVVPRRTPLPRRT